MTDIEQWVHKVTKYSSQYDSGSWSATNLCGPCNVFPKYGDLPGAWATGDRDANQFAEVEFKTAVFVTGIEIYETFHAGGTKYVAAWDGHQWATLWQTAKVEDIHQARVFSPSLMQGFKTKNLRIGLDCTAAGTWVEIDAIKLIGKPASDEQPAPQTNLAEELDNGPVKEQWVKKVSKFSSQYDSFGWGADQLCGEPRVYPNYGDQQGAWATEYRDDKQFAEVKFNNAVYVVGLDIYETYHAGGTKRIAALNDKDQWITLWETTTVQKIEEARIFSPPILHTNFKTKTIRIEIDCTAAGSWVEIDAIKLKGKLDNKDDAGKLPKKPSELSRKSSGSDVAEEQWVHKVKKFSSQYNEHSWNAGQLCDKPKVYPQYGDISGAWAMAQTDANQYVELEYKHSVYITGVAIYETYHAGGVKRISAKNDHKQWVTLWETSNVTDIAEARIFSPPVQTSFKTKDIRIDVDCSVAGTWVEIDAVKLIGKREIKIKSSQVKSYTELDPYSVSSVDIPEPVYVEPSKEPYQGPVKEQWAKKVTNFSSQYGTSSWKAEHVCGSPNVYPQYGDLPKAWATGAIDAHQFVEVKFKKAVMVTGIDIYETFHAGGVRRIAALRNKTEWVSLWETDTVTDIHQARIFSPPLKDTDFQTKNIRVEIDCTVANTWVEIDAIKLKGTKVCEDSSSSSDSDSDDDRKKKKKKSKKKKAKSKACILA